MTGLAREVLIGILVAALVGVGFAVSSAPSMEVAALLDHLERLGRQAFSPEPWPLVLIGGAGAAAVYALLGVVDASLGLSGDSSAGDVSTSLRSLSDVMADTRQRIEDAVPQTGTNVVQLFDEIVAGAVAANASDIHLSPVQEGVAVTYRVEGTLHDVVLLSGLLGPRLTVRAKVLARLDINAPGKPQDGRAVMQVRGERVDARVSSLPTELGDRLVLRLVRSAHNLISLQDLGLSAQVREGLDEVLGSSQGIFMVTGAVGSGKTTTLYACLQSIAARRGTTTSIVTLEDPIEAELPFATQTQMAERTGMTFASTLRSVLRQDPNVLMIGEIRDRETAEIAFQAGLTGHLILTSVHADSAAGPFARLHELQVDAFTLANATIGCLSQRLVRTLCVACRRPAEPDEYQVESFAQRGINLPRATFYEPQGCEVCDGLGFTGRIPISELLILRPDSRQAVHERKPTSEVKAIAVSEGMTTLLKDGLARAVSGETSLLEVLRVAG